jgi:hypothetical protein
MSILEKVPASWIVGFLLGLAFLCLSYDGWILWKGVSDPNKYLIGTPIVLVVFAGVAWWMEHLPRDERGELLRRAEEGGIFAEDYVQRKVERYSRSDIIG